MVSLFLMVFWTFVWAWWVVATIKVENYFTQRLQSVRAAQQVGYKKTIRRVLLTNTKYQVILALMLISGGMLIWAQLDSRKIDNRVEPLYTDQYIAVPMINADGEEIMQLQKI